VEGPEWSSPAARFFDVSFVAIAGAGEGNRRLTIFADGEESEERMSKVLVFHGRQDNACLPLPQ
jgi:hypothetical protein